MKVKVAEASGVVLDWLVAKSEGCDLSWDENAEDFFMGLSSAYCFLREFSPSTNPAQSWPIIEREITGVDLVSEWKGVKKWSARKFEYLPNDQTRCTEQYGPTPLIASMRCYVALRLGEEVEVPDELLET